MNSWQKKTTNVNLRIYVMLCAIWYHLCNLKNMKNTHGEHPTLLKARFLHVCFSHFLNCTNGTKSRKASYIDAFRIKIFFFCKYFLYWEMLVCYWWLLQFKRKLNKKRLKNKDKKLQTRRPLRISYFVQRKYIIQYSHENNSGNTRFFCCRQESFTHL